MYHTSQPVQVLSDVLGDAVHNQRFKLKTRYVKDAEEWLKLSKEETKALVEATYSTHPHLFKELKESVSLHHLKIIGFFPQMWPNTATGHDRKGTIAGQAFTEAYTIVINLENTYVVYIDSRYCYTVENPNSLFFEHLSKRMMNPLSRHMEYSKVFC